VKTAFALLLSCAALCLAQDAKPLPDAKTGNVKRLGSVTWDMATHKLVWMVEEGTLVDGGFVPSSGVKYEISPDDAMMMFGEEKRHFGAEEAANLHLLLNVLSRYCVDSVVWWEQGPSGPTSPQQSPHGSPQESPQPGPVTKPEQPAEPKQPVAPVGKPVKVAQQKPQQP
jgi:hypothetical protein